MFVFWRFDLSKNLSIAIRINGLKSEMNSYRGGLEKEIAPSLSRGVQQEHEKFVADLARFERIWRDHLTAWALMTPRTWLEIKDKDLPMVEVMRNTRRVIVRQP